MKCFQDKDFGSYWFESGTPTFLVKTLQNQPVQLQSILNGRKATEKQFKNYDPETKNMLPVIYQSGYLTIKDFEEEERLYTLGFPNFEQVADEGLKQIDEKGYSDRFAVSGKTMHKIALVFSSDGKGLLGWKL